MTIDLGNGKQIVITDDPRSENIWIALWANKGSIGLELTKKDAMELRRALFSAVYR